MANYDVSNEKLLEDIRITEKELSAYIEIYHGFKILSEIPENINVLSGSMYKLEYERYLKLAYDCGEFLHKLQNMQSDRRI
jgi:hypothetical protein